jgi:hypothetical protein
VAIFMEIEMVHPEISLGTRLFCTAACNLTPNTILEPGTFQQQVFDRLVIQVQTNPTQVIVPDAAWTGSIMSELAWEVIRLWEFPHRPSRLDCLFFWQGEEKARSFHSRRPWPTGLYEVEVIGCSRVFVADMNLISYFEKAETVRSMFARARRYWAAEVSDGEVLLEGKARIVRVLSSGPLPT